MNEMVHLHAFELVPVIELEPLTFGRGTIEPPVHGVPDFAEAWDQYWHRSVAAAGIQGLPNLGRGSWHVECAKMTDLRTLARVLQVLIDDWGGADSLHDSDQARALDGGFALRASRPEALIEPTCCCDLGDGADWAKAADYRGADWYMLWIGHPYLSVRYEAPNLVGSEPHESLTPVAKWTVDPARLKAEVARATAMQVLFADRISGALDLLGLRRDRDRIARRLAGHS